MRLDLESLALNGFVQFSCDSPFQSTLAVAQSIGEVASVPGLDPVQTLVPRKADSLEKSSYSGNFGIESFPMHTDMAHWYLPPRYFMLRCIQPAVEVVTRFVPATAIFSLEDRVTLNRALFRPRRRLDNRLTILRLRDSDMFRWDPLFLQPLNSRASALQTRIEQRMASTIAKTVAFESRTDCILVDNWNVLHGRSAVPSSATHRVVERAYLSNI
jgi:L-asparagine oxygenase